MKKNCRVNLNKKKFNIWKLISGNLVTGMNCKFSDKNNFLCESCCEGKNHRQPFPINHDKTICKPLELVHSDLCGPVTPTSLGGSNYFMTLIDECTKYTWVYALKSKDQVFSKFKEWKVFVEKQYNKHVKCKMFAE